jgi:CspA family cold shock protein
MARGTLKWFNRVSDYGFIACDEDGPDRYVRGENVSTPSALLAGSRVEYDARQGGMGPEAINVRRLAPIRRRTTGSFDQSRRHGPFDPRFRLRRAPASFALTSPSLETNSRTQPPAAAAKRLRESIDREPARAAVQEWESEGGTVATAH